MLDYNEIKPGCFVIFEGEPYEVLEYHVFRKQQRKPVNATKMKNLLTGRVVEHSFHVTDKAEEAEIVKKEAKFLYRKNDEFWFCDPGNPANRFKIDAALVGDQAKFMKENTILMTKIFDEKVFAVDLPIKMALKVTEAPPSVKGDTAKGGMKVVTLETGGTINAPLFVEAGDRIEVNTQTGEYVSRADK